MMLATMTAPTKKPKMTPLFTKTGASGALTPGMKNSSTSAKLKPCTSSYSSWTCRMNRLIFRRTFQVPTSCMRDSRSRIDSPFVVGVYRPNPVCALFTNQQRPFHAPESAIIPAVVMRPSFRPRIQPFMNSAVVCMGHTGCPMNGCVTKNTGSSSGASEVPKVSQFSSSQSMYEPFPLERSAPSMSLTRHLLSVVGKAKVYDTILS